MGYLEQNLGGFNSGSF